MMVLDSIIYDFSDLNGGFFIILLGDWNYGDLEVVEIFKTGTKLLNL
jgi:hypothetical protein